MDILCHICGEPWDTYEFHDAPRGMTYQQARAAFRIDGCVAMGGRHNAVPVFDADTLEGYAMVADILGDDVDALAAFCDDLGLT